MAESPEAQPSFELVSGLLAQVPQDRLVLLKHKLNCTHQGTRSCRLLQAMILLTLRREAEAREILDALGDDAAAAHLCRSHWGGTKAVSGVQPRKQEVLVAQAVAQVCSLLVDEKLCCPQARDEAYRAAIKAFRTSDGGHGAKLNALLAEAREKCGPGFALEAASGEFSSLKSDPEKLPRSDPVSINGLLAPLSQPLRSTGTPASFVSHFEISQSPTVPYLTRTGRWHGDSAPGSSVQPGEGSAGLESPSVAQPERPGGQDQPQSKGHSQGHRLRPAEGSAQSPVECTELPGVMSTGRQDLGEEPPPNLLAAPMLQTGPATERCIQTPTEDSCSLPQSTNPKSTPSSVDASPVTASSPADSQGEENPFFMFVVVHANEDELVACQVKERLENMGVSNGATFCEDFLIPGHNQLACFQDALDNSAYTLLLLTENFKSRLCSFQTNMALMDSFTKIVKSNSVIPFVPKESPLKKGEIPSMLVGIVSLDENSPVFAKRVKNTFRQSEFQRKKANWSMRQQIRHQERLQEEHRDYLQMQQRLFAFHLQSFHPGQMPFPTTHESFSGPRHAPPPFCLPTFPTPGIFQPESGPGQAPLFPPFPNPLPASMPQRPQPHLIIQNAQMVQIGDYNQMQVERTHAALGMAEDERTESQGVAVGAGAGSGHGDGT